MAIERLEDIQEPKDRELAKLLQEIVRIPSYPVKDEETGEVLNKVENEVVDYLEEWLENNTDLKIEKQELAGGRYNLIATKGEPSLVFLGHTDTVTPRSGAPYDPLAAEIHNGRIWGLGTTDMKSGIAAMAQAISLSPNADNIWALFYADEEFDFLGMKGLVEKYSEIRPKLLVSSDGSNLKIGHGCRGLMEFRVRVRGEAGHAAKGNGLNAIEGAFNSVVDLKGYLEQFKHNVMGTTSINLAYIFGGAEKEKGESYDSSRNLVSVEQEGNIIPDIAEFVIDIRPSSPELTSDKIEKRITESLEGARFSLESIKTRHDLGAWYTEIKDIEPFIELVKEVTGQSEIELEKPGASGYLDLQMLWEKTGRPTSIMFGGGKGELAHKPNEHIEIKDLIKERDFFKKILEKYAR